MDEVKAMAQAGESVGKAVGTGLRTIRRNAVRAGQAGAEHAAKAAAAAEHKLAEQVSAGMDNVGAARDELVKESRRTRRKLARNARKAAKKTAKNAGKNLGEVAKQAKRAGRKAGKAVSASNAEFSRKVQKKLNKLENKTAKLRRRAEKNPSGGGRRWLWLAGVGGVAAIAVVVLRSRQTPTETAPVIPLGGEAQSGQETQSSNGSAPTSAAHASEQN
jgi:hypothetical protein